MVYDGRMSDESRKQAESATGSRDVAGRVIGEWLERPTASVSLMAKVERACEASGVTGGDRALAAELVMGVARHQLTLAKVLGAWTRQGWSKVRHELQPSLLLGAYQILWLDGVPDFAAVNESVRMARKAAGPSGAKFVNAVLRNLLRGVVERRANLTDAPPRCTIPLDPGHGCVMDRDLFADPEHAFETWASEATSHPRACVKRWVRAYGRERARSICMAGMARPPIVLRPNAMKTTAEGLRDRLQAADIECALTPEGMVMLAPGSGRLTEWESFREGWFQPQDTMAARVVRQMGVKPGQRVLDLCAGVGTKATQLAEAKEDQGVVLASDRDAEKLDKVADNARRLGLSSVASVSADELETRLQEEPPLDWILIDVPCSNTGVLGRRPEARYRINSSNLRSLQEVQWMLCERAVALAGPETRIAYSTCSLEPEENAELMQRFGQQHPEWRLDASAQVLPNAEGERFTWHDGGYWAIWKRI